MEFKNKFAGVMLLSALLSTSAAFAAGQDLSASLKRNTPFLASAYLAMGSAAAAASAYSTAATVNMPDDMRANFNTAGNVAATTALGALTAAAYTAPAALKDALSALKGKVTTAAQVIYGTAIEMYYGMIRDSISDSCHAAPAPAPAPSPAPAPAPASAPVLDPADMAPVGLVSINIAGNTWKCVGTLRGRDEYVYKALANKRFSGRFTYVAVIAGVNTGVLAGDVELN